MKIDLALKKKLGRYWECTSYVWPYVREHFNSDEGKFIEFLERLDSHDAQKCLYSLFFYWAQNPVREKSNEQRSPNFDVFVYLLTLSVIEFLMQSTKNPWDRIDKFFNKYLNKEEMNFLNKQIKARREGRILKDKAAIRILYDMRNDFIHNAQQFPLISPDGGEFASVKWVTTRYGGHEYLADIRIKLDDYLDIFWRAYFRSFGLES